MKQITHLLSLAPLVALVSLAVGMTAPDVQPVATALVSGPVFLNGRQIQAASLSLGDGDRLVTGARGGAILTLSRTDGMVIGENSCVALVRRSGAVTAELDHGRVLVTSSHQRLREVRLAGEAVSIREAPGNLRRYQISRLPEATYVLARLGSISIFDEGYATRTEVPEGEVGAVWPEAASPVPPQGTRQQRRPPAAPTPPRPAAAPAGRRAGQITAAIPKDYIVRGPQQTEGNRGDQVIWEDLLRTEPSGRVRLVLDGGSILSLGSESRLRVVEHNEQSQQTALQLQFGRVRAEVVKLARTNARFEIRTNTAVCGVLGTDFFVEATEKSTRVIVFKGLVKVTPIVAGAVAGAVATVGAGQATTAGGGTASAPTTATAAQVQAAVNTTQASSAAVQASVAASRVALISATAVPPAAVTPVTNRVFTQVSPFTP